MINNKDRIDDLFRDSLGGHRVEPSRGLYRRIEARLFPIAGRRRAWLLLALLLFLMTGTALVTWQVLPHKVFDIASVTPPPSLIETEMTSQENSSPSAAVSEHSPTEVYSSNNESFTSNKPPAEPLLPQAGYKRTEMSSHASDVQRDPYSGEWKRSSVRISFMNGYSDDVDGYLSLWTGPLVPVEPSVALPVYKGLKNEYARKYELLAGAYFLPVMLFYDPNPNNTGWSAGLDLDYDRSRFHVYAGAGTSVFKDKGSWEIQYESYDSVGYFMNITSFRVNPESPNDIIFNMSEETVFDSVPHIVVTEKTNTYTYLDLPAGIGFTVWGDRRLSLTVKTGIKFSYLLAKNEPTADFSLSGANDVIISRLVPERTSANWRFTAGLEASWLITGRLALHLEPVFEQYLSPVYVSTPGYEAGKPYLIGVNLGLRYRIR